MESFGSKLFAARLAIGYYFRALACAEFGLRCKTIPRTGSVWCRSENMNVSICLVWLKKAKKKRLAERGNPCRLFQLGSTRCVTEMNLGICLENVRVQTQIHIALMFCSLKKVMCCIDLRLKLLCAVCESTFKHKPCGGGFRGIRSVYNLEQKPV